MDIEVVKETLSDNSTVFNVVFKQDSNEIVFACTGEYLAKRLAQDLRECSWIEIN